MLAETSTRSKVTGTTASASDCSEPLIDGKSKCRTESSVAGCTTHCHILNQPSIIETYGKIRCAERVNVYAKVHT